MASDNDEIFSVNRTPIKKKKKKIPEKKTEVEEYRDEVTHKKGISKLKLKKKSVSDPVPEREDRPPVSSKSKTKARPKAKSKPKVSREPREARTEAALKRTEKKVERLKTVVEGESKEIKKIVKKVEELSANDPNGYLEVYLDMFTKQRRIILKTEKKILSRRSKCTGKEIYHLSTMYSQLRETIADLRSISDLSEHADRLILQAVQPIFTTILQSISDSMHEVKVRVRDKLVEKSVKRTFDGIDETTIELGRKMQGHYEKLTNDIKSLLLE
jgi:hypothetical protein